MKTVLTTSLCLALSFGGLGAKDADSSRSIAKSLSSAFTSVAKQATPAVVFIKAEGHRGNGQDYYGRGGSQQNPYDSYHEEFFNRFFGAPPKYQQPQPQHSQGSGFLISPDGYIMTNYHVVKDAGKLSVVLQDGYNYETEATLVGGDPHTDLAILKIAGDNHPYLKFADSEDVEVGEWCIAIGSPFQLEATVTVGVVSAKGRQNLQITELEDFIQTDAAINPGNSGGPLLNLDGEVIGINTAIVSRSGGYMGIGFAIPSNIANNIRSQIVENGKINPGFMGVQLQPIDKNLAESFKLKKPDGAIVSEVVADSPAEKAGIKQGDIIIGLNGNPVKSVAGLRREIMLMQPGQVAKLRINRDGKVMTLKVTLGTHPRTASIDSSEAAQKLGLEVEALTPEKAGQLGLATSTEGVLISGIRSGSIAQMAGIRPGSVIIAVNHSKVTDLDSFREALSQETDNGRTLLLVNYKGQHRFYSLKVR